MRDTVIPGLRVPASCQTADGAPLSAAQRRLWFMSQLHGADAVYTIPAALRLHGPLDVAALRGALAASIARHAALRTRFELDGAEPRQWTVAPAAIDLPIADLTDLPEDDREAAARERAVAAARRPFDLAGGILLRPFLLRLRADDHLLLTAMHHIVSDGASIRVLHRDLMEYYDAELTGRAPGLPELPQTFADLCRRERSPEASAVAARDLTYWQQRLAGAPAVLTVPADGPRPPMPSFTGITEHCELPAASVNRVLALARAERVTPFMVYSAAFHAMLARYSGQDDITLGFAVLGRSEAASRDLIGLFANTLAQRVNLHADPTGRELLRAVQSEVVEATRHDQLRFEELVDAQAGTRALDRHPVFQAAIDYFGSVQPVLTASTGLVATPILLDTDTARFDLELCLRQNARSGGSDVAMKCNADLFARASVRRMAGHYVRLLNALTTDPGQHLSVLPLSSPAEESATLAAATGPRAAYPLDGTLHELVDRQLRRDPDRCAVKCGGRELTAGMLDLMADRVAGRLRALGVQPDTVVGICAHRSPEMVAGLLGILRAGGAYLPLDPDYPADRLRQMVQDAAPRAVLVSRETAALVTGTETLIHVDDLSDEKADEPRPPYRSQHPDTLAYVIYTSGSTGSPKGVAVSHRAIRNRLLWMQDAYRLGVDDTVLQKTSLSFDVSVWEVFWPLMTGACLLLARPGGHRDAHYLRALIASERVTVTHFVPSMLRVFVGADGLHGCAGLRLMVCSGEALPEDLAEDVAAGCPADLHNLYGPTEAAVDVTAFPCRRSSGSAAVRPGVVPIGRPIGGTEVYVLDRWLRPVPPGVVGQIYLGGVQLARGYLGQPGLTADRFIPDPHGAPGGRLYRTGDLGRMSADGVIEFVGRMDSQVKLRGFRIELGDVEAALNLVPGVRGSVVFLDGDRLLGYVAAPNQDTVTSLGLRAALAEKLPTYMIPAVLGVVPAIPLLPTGKADRSQLPPLKAAPHDDAECEPAPPATEAERQLAQIWAAVLDCDTPPVNVSFFVAGGDSLKSIELVIRAREHGLGLTVEDVFAHPTIRELGAVAQPVAEADDREEEPFAQVAEESRQALAEDVEDAYPLSALLGGLVFESLSNPDYRLYITSLRIDGRFDEAALRDAVGVVTRRHPFLRSSVSLTGASEPLQLVHATVGDPVRVIDLQDLDTTEQQAQLESWLDRERHTRFNWSEPPLLRVSVHLLKPTGFQLTLAEPFLDGWSVTLTLTQLLEAYEDLLDGSQPDQEVRPSRYGAFLRAERAALDSDETRRFWAARLHAAQTAGSRLPRLAGGEALPSGYVRLEVDVPLATSDRLRGLARQLAVPLKSVLLAVHVQVLASQSGRAEVLTGLMANARPEARAGTQSVGLFLNVTPLLVRIQGSWRDLVRAVHAAEAETLSHRAYPFTAMLRDAAVTHPIDAVFNFTHFYPYQRVGRRGHIRIQGARATDQTLFPLTAQFRQDPTDSRLGLSLEFSAPGFSAAQRQGIAERYRQTLDQMSRGPDASCAVDPPPEPAEPDPAWSPASLHELFAIQARKDPDAIALHGPEPDQIWSYGRLSAAAAELRARLATSGVRGGTPVGVCLPRSPELIATVLAVLSAGAGYVPLDPALPPARITELIDAARCAVVVVADSTRPRVHARTPVVDTASLPTRAQFSARNLRVAAEPSAPAYVMFTSGSTGRPKPVVVPHRAVVNRLRWGWETAPFGPSEVCCLKTPIGFVDSIAEMFSGLLHGVPTVIVPDSVQDPARLVRLLSRSGVSRITLVPSLLAEVLRLAVDLNATLPRLRHWTLSGEPLPDDLAAELMRRIPGARVWNLYGSTEVAADALAYQVQGDEGSPVVPLGRPITGARAYVLDELGNFAPAGTAGELVIGGRAVGTCYAGNPRLTAERFMPDPAGPAGARLYRTGDLVRCDPDGVFHYLGRGDRQIKVRGVRLEPVEIEMALRAHPSVAEAVVVQRGASGRQPRLTGYVELVRPASAGDRPEAEVSSMLRTWLRKRLSAAAVPEVFVLITAWPRTPSGKIDHQVLPAPPVRGTATPRPHEPPETLAERELATLWRDRLGIERIDRYDDFFAMGGHSLHAILLAARVEERLGVPFSVSDLFEHPTLEAQAELVEKLVLADADARPTTVSKEES